MTRKRKSKRWRAGVKPGPSNLHRRVKEMAAAGLVEDQITARLPRVGDKNQLRRKYIDAIKQGREIARAEANAIEGEKLTVEEETKKRAMFAGFGTGWENADGSCDLHHGNTLEQQKELFAKWLAQHRRGDDPVRFGDPV